MQKITCFVALLLMATICSAQQAQLRLNLEKGGSYKQVTNSKTTVVQEVGGQKMNINMAVTGSLSFLVRSVAETEYDLEARFESLTMSIETPQGVMNFSSEASGENDIFSAILKEMVDKPFAVMMAKSGQITRVGGVENLWEGAINQFGELSQMQKDQIKAQLLNSYGEKALKGNIEMVTAVYPDHPVRIGDKWTVNTDLESGMSAKVSSEYTFTKMTAERIVLNGVSKIATTDTDAYVETNGMPMKYNLNGRMTSEIQADRKTGWIHEATISQEIAGDAQINDNPQVPGGMTIPMTITSLIVITN